MIYITTVLVVSFYSNVLVLPSVLEPGLDLGVAKTKSSRQAAALLNTAARPRSVSSGTGL